MTLTWQQLQRAEVQGGQSVFMLSREMMQVQHGVEYQLELRAYKTPVADRLIRCNATLPLNGSR